MINKKNPKFIKVDDCEIGDNKPCFIVAEIGSNHNQNFKLACKLIDQAAFAGVDAVKFQTFRASDHYSRKAPSFSTFIIMNASPINEMRSPGLIMILKSMFVLTNTFEIWSTTIVKIMTNVIYIERLDNFI